MDHAWLEVCDDDKYKEYTAMDFSEFSMEGFVELTRKKLEFIIVIGI